MKLGAVALKAWIVVVEVVKQKGAVTVRLNVPGELTYTLEDAPEAMTVPFKDQVYVAVEFELVEA